MKTNWPMRSLICVLMFAMTACGGGGDDNGSSSASSSSISSVAPTFSITASIIGLTANGLVLQNNGGSGVTVASGAATATIATGVSSGTSYAVSVQTQPTGRFCTVANGSGTVSANVSNVAVTCTAISSTTYTVGGTITGLGGTGLGLRLNGSTDAAFNVSPASGAISFAFTAGLQTGTAYSVTIPSQPTGPTQGCFFTAGQTGTIGTSNVSNVAITCNNSAPYTVSGTVSGLTATGLSLRMGYTGATTPADLNVMANSLSFAFTETIPANGGFTIGILTQPVGQSCTIVRARGVSSTNVTNVGVACINNALSVLTGTYSLLNSQGRGYLNFNADGTYTMAIINNDTGCNTATDTRNGNGVEYGVFAWNSSTSAFSLPTPPVVDTNGGCGLADSGDFSRSYNGTIVRSGNTIAVQGDAGPVILTAVGSDPATLVGAFVSATGNGRLLVFHADGTFMLAETQGRGGAFFNTQERGCYALTGATVTLTIGGNCRPDGFASYDVNGGYGFGAFVVTPSIGPLPFTIDNPTTITINGEVFKRTQPN